jgi:hypothetical protein
VRVLRVRPEEQEHRQVDVAGIEIEALVVTVLLVPPAQMRSVRFAGIAEAGKVFDRKQEYSVVFTKIIECVLTIVAQQEDIELSRTFATHLGKLLGDPPVIQVCQEQNCRSIRSVFHRLL